MPNKIQKEYLLKFEGVFYLSLKLEPDVETHSILMYIFF